MKSICLAHEVDWDGFRAAARTLAMDGTEPDQVAWSVGAPDDLFAEAAPDPAPPSPPLAFTLPRALVDLAQTAIQASEPQRFSWIFALILRAHRGERTVLEQVTDPHVVRVTRLAQAVRRDTHKMRAFLRFRAVEEEGATRHVAWFEPSHFIVEANAPFFVRRFATMIWSILTPYRSAHWTGAELSFGPGAKVADVPDDDRLAAYWRVYFRSIFNPARLKVAAMQSEMPKKYWRNLPEAAEIADLVRGAQGRTAAMLDAPLTAPRATGRRPSPASSGDALAAAAAEAAACQRCPLWQPATQTVFGEGPAGAGLMFVGEQPGDQEDLIGRPFVGPAGQLFDKAMVEAEIDRAQVYVTNAVKHFKFEPRGKRRIHAKPELPDIEACRPWLARERDLVRPRVIVLMGATAARAVLGRVVGITRERGQRMTIGSGLDAVIGLITVHPSYLLRLPDEAAKAREYAAFVTDLRLAATLLQEAV